jgi:hypothetical protein
MLFDPVLWIVIGVCAYVGRDKDGRWYHALLVVAVTSAFALYNVVGYRVEAGLSPRLAQTIVVIVVPQLIIGALTFFIVRALRDRTWNVLR